MAKPELSAHALRATIANTHFTDDSKVRVRCGSKQFQASAMQAVPYHSYHSPGSVIIEISPDDLAAIVNHQLRIALAGLAPSTESIALKLNES